MLDILRQRTRRIMLDLVLDTGLSDEWRSMCINGGAGVGMSYLEAERLGLVRLKPEADPESFRFDEIAALVDGVQALIDEEEARAYADLAEISAHRRIKLKAEMRRLGTPGADDLTEGRVPAVWVEPRVSL